MAITELNDKTFEKAVSGTGTPTMVVFYSAWCTTCEEMMPTVEQLAEDYAGRLTLYKIDFDDNLDSVVEHGVMVVPTTFIFKDGDAKERMAGLQERDVLEKRLAQHL